MRDDMSIFFERQYAILNEYNPSVEGISYEELLRIEEETKLKNINKSIEDFKEKIALMDATKADEKLNELLNEIRNADEKIKKAKARK